MSFTGKKKTNKQKPRYHAFKNDQTGKETTVDSTGKGCGMAGAFQMQQLQVPQVHQECHQEW